ncbi:MAG: pentapeptide repeat-containing protein [Desulfarculales bacterium]|jgi:uncharacterized protein YjbI with pentapeptide repeats|nr:pentapeptide repeat-containing protein [Desulfarculales bacterium]
MGILGLTVEEINANPSILNGRSISGTGSDGAGYDGLRLENVTLSHTTFNNMWSVRFYFKNVVFKNCSFIDCEFYEGHMENVIFKGGVMSNSTTRQEAGHKSVDWRSVNVNKVVLDGVSMRGAKLGGMWGGSMTFRNMSAFGGYRDGAILIGRDLQFRIDNCKLDANAAATEEDLAICDIYGYGADVNTIYATNSKFTNRSGFGNSKTRATYIDNCEFTGSASLGYPQVMVVKNSTLAIAPTRGGNLYFVNNKFVPFLNRYGQSSPSSINSTNVYIFNDKTALKSEGGGKNAAPMPIHVKGGGANIYNLDLQEPRLQGDIKYLNLRNVRILGGEWFDLNLRGGQWENVEIHKPIEIKGAAPQFGKDLKFYNLTFHPPAPTGPFNVPIRFSAKESKQPFEWPEVHVPTLKEMGINPD